MKLEDLKNEIPFKWRVQSVNQWGANCIAYIDARAVQDLLDEVCGADKWQCKYSEHKGNLFCSIGISCTSQTIWKSDCGTESNVEKQKGEASDAFKRAAVMWGVGRFLYSKEIVKLEVIQKNNKWIPAYNGKALYGDEVSNICNLKTKKPSLIVESDEFKGRLSKGTPIEIMEKHFTITDKTKEEYIKQLKK